MADEQGDEELQRYFKDISFKVKRELVTVIKAQADDLAAAIKAEAPVKTGRLRDSVAVRRGRNTLELIVTAGGDSTTVSERGAGGAYDYSLAIEYGTSRQPAQPFFWRVYRQKRPEIERAISDAVEQALKG
jgi:HK97 gp10 family phage protein